MALAKSVLCHIGEGAAQDNPFGAELPIVGATPDTLLDRLRDLVAILKKKRSGAASRAFVELRHDPRAVAREVLSGLAELRLAGERG